MDADLLKYKEQMARLPDGPIKGNIRQQALRTLQQKKQYENQRAMMQSQSFNMEQTNFATESLKETQTMVDAMQTSVKDMKAFNKKVNIDKVEDMRYDLEDLMYESTEINEVMSRNYELPGNIDEADLEAELDALDAYEGIGEADTSYLDAIPNAPATENPNQVGEPAVLQ